VRAFLVVRDVNEKFVKRTKEQNRLLGEMYANIQDWINDLLRDAFDPQALIRLLSDMKIDPSFNLGVLGQKGEGFDYYRVLGLEKTATDESVKKRYRELLFKLHPDTAGTQGTEFFYQMINAAYRQIAKERGWQ
jgi:DnaJ-domain-containing protein 1